MKKILFAVALVAMSCTFVSCDADSIDSGLSTGNAADTGGPGGSGGSIPTVPPPPPPPKDSGTGR